MTMKTKAATRSNTSELSAFSGAELEAKLARRKRRVQTLARRHDRLIARASELKAQIEALGGSGGRAAPGEPTAASPVRPRNEANLVESLKRVLGNRTMTVAEAVKAVLESGYQTTSPSFRQIVNLTFIRSGEFERVGRGEYRVK